MTIHTPWGSAPHDDERKKILADLRAQVEAKHDSAEARYRAKADHYYEGSMDAYSVVLDLIDGEQR